MKSLTLTPARSPLIVQIRSWATLRRIWRRRSITRWGALGRPAMPAEAVRHLVGHGVRALLRRGLAASSDADERLVEQGFPIFLEHYAANICVGTRCYPHLEEALIDSFEELIPVLAAIASVRSR
ncbi:MAG TPA: hypothetical protein VEW71_03100 [Allosphingosinicella sp.]|nr:hypothetical protein [Allosphingosinicella sp.]